MFEMSAKNIRLRLLRSFLRMFKVQLHCGKMNLVGVNLFGFRVFSVFFNDFDVFDSFIFRCDEWSPRITRFYFTWSSSVVQRIWSQNWRFDDVCTAVSQSARSVSSISQSVKSVSELAERKKEMWGKFKRWAFSDDVNDEENDLWLDTWSIVHSFRLRCSMPDDAKTFGTYRV